MNEIDKLRRAKLYMDKLSNGVDPNSGMRVHEDDIVRDSRVIACFEYISRVLEWEIESFENRPAAPEKPRRVFINDDQFSQLQLNYGECKVSDITNEINRVVKPEERLTDSAYRYDSNDHIFELASEHEARMDKKGAETFAV